MTKVTEYLDAPVFRLVSGTARELGLNAYVIGGYVRDCFLGRPNNDIDIVVQADERFLDFARDRKSVV